MSLKFIDDSNPAIVYPTSSDWTLATDETNDFFNNTYRTLTTTAADFAGFGLDFHGTSISIWVGNTGARGEHRCRIYFDGSDESALFPCGTRSTSIAREKVSERKGLSDSDHSINIYIDSEASLAFDGFEIERENGDPLQLDWLGFNATEIPQEAIIIDGSDPKYVKFNNASNWDTENGASYYNGESIYNFVDGSSFEFEFERMAVWWYANGPIRAPDVVQITIDGVLAETEPMPDTPIRARAPSFKKTDLIDGPHMVVNITEGSIASDFFRVLQSNPLGSTDDPSTTSQQPPGSTNVGGSKPSNSVPIGAIVGIVIGILLICSTIGIFCWLRRRRRDYQISFESPEAFVKPYTSAAPLDTEKAQIIMPFTNSTPPQPPQKGQQQLPAYTPLPCASPQPQPPFAPLAPSIPPATSHSLLPQTQSIAPFTELSAALSTSCPTQVTTSGKASEPTVSGPRSISGDPPSDHLQPESGPWEGPTGLTSRQ